MAELPVYSRREAQGGDLDGVCSRTTPTTCIEPTTLSFYMQDTEDEHDMQDEQDKQDTQEKKDMHDKPYLTYYNHPHILAYAV